MLPTLFWLTALGLQTGRQDGLALLACAFFPVYEAVARSDYPSEAWDLLAPILPDLLLGWEWDRCRRLRLALRSWLRDNPKFAGALVQAAPKMEYAELVQSLRPNVRR